MRLWEELAASRMTLHPFNEWLGTVYTAARVSDDGPTWKVLSDADLFQVMRAIAITPGGYVWSRQSGLVGWMGIICLQGKCGAMVCGQDADQALPILSHQ